MSILDALISLCSFGRCMRHALLSFFFLIDTFVFPVCRALLRPLSYFLAIFVLLGTDYRLRSIPFPIVGRGCRWAWVSLFFFLSWSFHPLIVGYMSTPSSLFVCLHWGLLPPLKYDDESTVEPRMLPAAGRGRTSVLAMGEIGRAHV